MPTSHKKLPPEVLLFRRAERESERAAKLAGAVIFPCLECGKHVRALNAHLRVHNMSLDEYRARHTVDGTGDDVTTGWTVSKTNPSPKVKSEWDAARVFARSLDPTDHAPTHLNDLEQDVFNARYKTLFFQADEDPALESTVDNIILNEIYLARYQEQIARLTSKAAFKVADASLIRAISTIVKDLQKSNLDMMNSLSITRDQKQRNRKIIESTPSRLVSSFESYLRNMSPEALRRQNQEMDEAVARMRRNLTELKNLIPSEAVLEIGDLSEPDADI